METISAEVEELLEGSFRLRKTLEQVLPKEAVDYILRLIVKDGAHRKFLKITKETKT
jgi:hypothetical protein